MASNDKAIDIDQDVFDDDEEKYDGSDNGLVAGPKLSGVLVDYRVTFKGHGKIFTGASNAGRHAKHPKGRIVTGVDRTIAEDLQERGFAEIVDGSEVEAPAPAAETPAAPKTDAPKTDATKTDATKA